VAKNQRQKAPAHNTIPKNLPRWRAPKSAQCALGQAKGGKNVSQKDEKDFGRSGGVTTAWAIARTECYPLDNRA